MALDQISGEDEERRDRDQRELKPEEKRNAEKLRFDAVVERCRQREDAWRQQKKILHVPPGAVWLRSSLPEHRFYEPVKIARGPNVAGLRSKRGHRNQRDLSATTAGPALSRYQ
jgi:hypothetical protein